LKTTSYHKINAPESDYLYIEASQLPGAGKGLFTALPIYKDEMIAIYQGEILTDAQAAMRAASGHDQYFINMPDGSIMDSMNEKGFAKYANDASSYRDASFSNNAKIALDDEDQVGLIAIRNIKAGEEIFCSYGKAYWKKHKND
jgi:SET domain-containing protein